MDTEAEADRATWLAYFQLAIEGTAAVSTETSQKLVQRACAIADAAVEALKKRAPR